MKKNIIFDWSGTLSDDLRLSYTAAMYIFDHYGHPRLTLEEYRGEFCLPYMEFYLKFLPGCQKEVVDRLFHEKYPTLDPPVVYEGVVDLVELLKQNGKQLLVLSSVTQHELERDAKRYGVAKHMNELCGSVYDKRESIQAILKRNGFRPAESCFVGDMAHDVAAATAAEVTSVGVTWGYQSQQQLEKNRPDYIVHTMEGLLALLLPDFISN